MIQSSLYAALGTFKPTILATKDAKEALEALQVWRFFSPHTPVFVLPDLRAHYLDDMRAFSSELKELLSTLGRFYTSLRSDPNTKLLAPLSALLHPYLVPNSYKVFVLLVWRATPYKSYKKN
ncbi:hypothetical protein NHP190012_00300 [Helicobacter sp. NHP19-012]|uniref:Uncharacterized protein n=1 Tax=Helicobacter gastrofelis TaxID=2849642 RepID=A0ABN6I8H9_9HELI|nr:hypothetical protein NHP190012_00300 [Helicobacter sp. NHP19-012]